MHQSGSQKCVEIFKVISNEEETLTAEPSGGCWPEAESTEMF